MPDVSNKRGFSRVTVHIKGELADTHGNVAHGAVRDLSMNGVFIETIDKIEPGESCSISLILDGGVETLRVEAEGHIIRAGNNGLAVEFTQTDLDSIEHLHNLVRLNSCDPDRVEDELDDSVGIKRLHETKSQE